MGIFGFFCPPKDDAKDEEEDHTAFDTPSYTQENFEGDVTPSSSTPPIGVRLHGGLKLREEGLTGKGIKVAVLDTGIKPVTQFNGKVVQHSKFRTGKMPHHGTHVAGTIHMMAPEAEIYDYRVLGPERVDGFSSNGAAIREGVKQAVADGCDIINMSLVGSIPDNVLHNIIREPAASGTIIVAACGNSGEGNVITNKDGLLPASFASVLSVGAVAKKGNLPIAHFSQSNDQVDCCGIGVEVVSFSKHEGLYMTMSGTGMACPHISGLIAALMTKGGKYENTILHKEIALEFLKDNCAIHVANIGGQVNATGYGFLTYLTEEEFMEEFKNQVELPEF